MDKIKRLYYLKKTTRWFKKELLFVIAFICAVGSTLALPIDTQTATSLVACIDFKVISLLLCLMAIVRGIAKIGCFNVLSQKLLSRVKSSRGLAIILVLLCFFSAMVVTNSVALLAFVPFTVLVLTAVGWQDKLVWILALQTIAANIGGMLTPIGNAQNLFLFTKYQLSPQTFFATTTPIVVLAISLVVIMAFFYPTGTVQIRFPHQYKISDQKRFLLHIILLCVCLLCVFKAINYSHMLLIVVAALIIFDLDSLLRIDWLLLATLVCFFVVSFNLSRVDGIVDILTKALAGKEFFASVALSQIISNVPTAILLSGFTENAKALLAGTNIASFGTVIASLGSLVSYKMYTKTEQATPLKYLGVFTLQNVIILVILYFFAIGVIL